MNLGITRALLYNTSVALMLVNCLVFAQMHNRPLSDQSSSKIICVGERHERKIIFVNEHILYSVPHLNMLLFG